jgi:hypothetical protein
MTEPRRATSILGAALLILAVGAGASSTLSKRAEAEDLPITSLPVARFMSANAGERVQGLVWRGGIEMQSPIDTFGGLSGLGFISDDQKLVLLSDRGNFISGQLIYDEAGRVASLIGVTIEPLQNSKGAELPRAYARDSESLAVVYRDGMPSAVRVGFENLTRVADFQLADGRPQGPAREIPIPKWLTDTRTNETLEAICIAPPASAVAGSTLLISEGIFDDVGNRRGYMLGKADTGPITYVSGIGTNPTDCAFLPNGDLLVLERGVALIAFRMRLARIPAAEVKPGAVLEGETLLETTGGDIDNMEALAVHTAPDGSTRITMVSDNNFNDWQRNLLLQFSLPE